MKGICTVSTDFLKCLISVFAKKHSLKPNYMIYQSYQRKLRSFFAMSYFLVCNQQKSGPFFSLAKFMMTLVKRFIRANHLIFSFFWLPGETTKKKSFPSPECLWRSRARRRFSWPLSIRSLGRFSEKTQRTDLGQPKKNWVVGEK